MCTTTESPRANLTMSPESYPGASPYSTSMRDATEQAAMTAVSRSCTKGEGRCSTGCQTDPGSALEKLKVGNPAFRYLCR